MGDRERTKEAATTKQATLPIFKSTVILVDFDQDGILILTGKLGPRLDALSTMSTTPSPYGYCVSSTSETSVPDATFALYVPFIYIYIYIMRHHGIIVSCRVSTENTRPK